jgi:hypothetical protein
MTSIGPTPVFFSFCIFLRPGGPVIDLMNRRLQHRLTEPEILKIFSNVCEVQFSAVYKFMTLIRAMTDTTTRIQHNRETRRKGQKHGGICK